MAGKYSYNRTWKTIVIRFSILSCLLVLQIVALAQVKFYTRIDPAVTGRNQPVQVQYVIENAKSIDEFKAPAFDDFMLIQGPIESSGMSIINGSTTQYKSLLFLLQPKTIGKLNIKGATALVDGKQMKSNSAVVQVINKNVTTPQSSNPGFNFNFPEERPDVDREFYLRPGENVIEKIKACEPKVILMDNKIPETGGIAATRLIKQTENTKNIPVIFFSANTNVAQLSKEAEADHFLQKPFDITELENMIELVAGK